MKEDAGSEIDEFIPFKVTVNSRALESWCVVSPWFNWNFF